MSMSGPTQPVTTPIPDVPTLLAWGPTSDPFGVFNQAIVPRVFRGLTGPSGPTVPFMFNCQPLDYADYPPQGLSARDNYALRWWQYVDVITFFGGSLFYIPSPAWTNAAHKNGVPCLGTIRIDTQAQMTALIQNQAAVIQQIINVTQYYGFDGWFFNAELGVDSNLASQFITFVQTLTAQMHQNIPGSLVIWYDAMTSSGVLDYQNELNQYNIAFFNATDGLFTNYWWNLNGGDPSPENSYKNAVNDNANPLRVYTAVNSYGGDPTPVAGYQCAIGVTGAVSAGTSAGLWAPGWSFQNAETPLNGFRYDEGDSEYWQQIGTVFPARVAAWQFPFVTHFDSGSGNQFCINGEISNHHWYTPWSNVSQQDVLPTFRNALTAGSPAAIKVDLSNACPFDGGGCVRITGDPSQGPGFAAYSLYTLNLPLTGQPLTVSYTYAASLGPTYWSAVQPYPDVAIVVVFSDGSASVLLSGPNSPCNNKAIGSGTPTYLSNGQVTTFGRDGAAGTRVTWNQVEYNLGNLSGVNIVEIRLLAAWTGSTAEAPVPFINWSALGELKLLNGTPPALTSVTGLNAQGATWSGSTVTLNLFWTPPANISIRHYDVYVNSGGGWTWLGRAFCAGYWVSAASGSNIQFGVACADTSGQFESTSQMATVTVSQS